MVERFDADWEVAQAFYRRIEADTGAGLLSIGPAVYAFASVEQAEKWRSRRPQTAPAPHLPSCYRTPHGAAQAPNAGRLNVAAFLDATHATWRDEGALMSAKIDPQSIHASEDAVELVGRQLRAKRLVMSVGAAAVDWPQTAGLPWALARGELLTVRLPGVVETRVVRGGVWLAPLGEGLFRVGATYDCLGLSAGPTPKGRAWLLERLSALIEAPAEVVAHDSGVRPLLAHRLPSSGWSQDNPRIGWLNGLGSHGVLRAPRLAITMAAEAGAG
ncbi:tRNA 5-methylaminomethyl-2-thiouridine biosynthesis bifunctional protein MnmC [Pirellulimonas nuda]|uniref:tRNA 5-methylaminomethyl-2-thiouridine biosynthesis bifunctional protein MnmC n=2 Tax=Pirellulimonas nuda TaxID=2528009 RepID=A0A518DJS7_9BACT|nr:tRNA 5-methylaminomethyl-2-thiouridine biosynthesis bifunctional protein MnmC [Pirellulimonas nuda]